MGRVSVHSSGAENSPKDARVSGQTLGECHICARFGGVQVKQDPVSVLEEFQALMGASHTHSTPNRAHLSIEGSGPSKVAPEGLGREEGFPGGWGGWASGRGAERRAVSRRDGSRQETMGETQSFLPEPGLVWEADALSTAGEVGQGGDRT